MMVKLFTRRSGSAQVAATVLEAFVVAVALNAEAVGIRGIAIDRTYMTADEKALATIAIDESMNVPVNATARFTLRVTLLGEAEVTTNAKTPAGPISRQLAKSALNAAVKDGAATVEVSLPGVLIGRARVKAEILAADGKQVAMAQSPALEIGVRRRLDLAGDWDVVSAKLLEGEVPWRAKDWKLPKLPATVRLPGVLPFGQDFHTVAIEIRDRRDLYLNNERFIVKGQGSYAHGLNARLQLQLKGGNAFRGHRPGASRLVPGLQSEAEYINGRLKDGLLTSAGSALLASCEKCTFWDPKDTSNVHKAIKNIIRDLAQCPGIIQWEATNELHGEPPEARVEILNAFHMYDPYHRPVLCTKGSGEWEAEAHEGRVAGTDIVGCQYLLNKESLDSVFASITEQPIMSTEVNYNDGSLFNENRMFETWIEKGVCGSLLFDYSGSGLDQPVPLIPPTDRENNVPGYVIRESMRLLYQDLVATASRRDDGRVLLSVANRMPYTLNGVAVTVREGGTITVANLAPGAAADVLLPPKLSPQLRQRLVLRATYTTHRGLPHVSVLSPEVTAGPATVQTRTE